MPARFQALHFLLLWQAGLGTVYQSLPDTRLEYFASRPDLHIDVREDTSQFIEFRKCARNSMFSKGFVCFCCELMTEIGECFDVLNDLLSDVEKRGLVCQLIIVKHMSFRFCEGDGQPKS